MTRTADTFGGKLRRWFLGFAAVILAVLWLLQTVLLGSAYDAMHICRVRRAADALSSTLDATAGKLRSLENARRTLIANVSHDLRTPLTMIKGYAELVRDVSWADDRQRREDLSVIIREADRLSALVRDLLDYAAAQDAGETGCIFWFELPACADSPDAMPRSSEDDVLEPGKAENTACD